MREENESNPLSGSVSMTRPRGAIGFTVSGDEFVLHKIAKCNLKRSFGLSPFGRESIV